MRRARLGVIVGPRRVGWRARPYGWGWGWGPRRGSGLLGLLLGLIVLGVLALFVCSFLGFLAFRR